MAGHDRQPTSAGAFPAVLLFLAVGLATSVTSITPAVAAVSQRESQRESHRVPIIVEVAADNAPDVIDAILGRVAPDVAAGARRFDRVPLVALDATAEDMAWIGGAPGVTRVWRDRPRRAALAVSVPQIGAPAGWAAAGTGVGQTIAIVDTGVDRTHPMLAGKVTAEACFSSARFGSRAICPGADPTSAVGAGAARPCLVTSGCAHGTHTAAIAAGGSAGGFSGVAPGASIAAVQVFSALDRTVDCSPDPAPCVVAWDSDIVRALEYLDGLRRTVPIAAVNLSLGGVPSSPGCTAEPEASVISSLRAGGVAVVAATGNAGDKVRVDSPACIPGVIGVGAVDGADRVPAFANSASGPGLSLVAPGVGIVSAVPASTPASLPCPEPFAAGRCAAFDGTSAAAPHVAGALAVLAGRGPASSPDDRLALMRGTGVAVRDAANGVVTPRLSLGAAARPPTFHPLRPARILDTRDGTGLDGPGPIGPGAVIDLVVTGAGGVPASGVSAVVLNVTADRPSAATHISAWPAGYPRPAASNLNLLAGDTRAGLVTIAVGVGGRVSLFNNAGAAEIIADVSGWYDDGGARDSGLRFVPVTPVRVADTRDGTGGVAAVKIGAGGVLTVPVASRCATSGVGAVALNVTAVLPDARTHVTVWPAGETVPAASSLNLDAGAVRPNLAIVGVGAGGAVSVRNNSGEVDLVVDVSACFVRSDGLAGRAGRFVPVVPVRVLDTRDGTGIAPAGPISGGRSIDVIAGGRGGVPSAGTSGVVVTVTATGPTMATHLTAWPAGAARPLVSNLNLAALETAANAAHLGVSAATGLSLFTNSGSVHLVADVAGWYTA